jgi:hypothetical protein
MRRVHKSPECRQEQQSNVRLSSLVETRDIAKISPNSLLLSIIYFHYKAAEWLVNTDGFFHEHGSYFLRVINVISLKMTIIIARRNKKIHYERLQK